MFENVEGDQKNNNSRSNSEENKKTTDSLLQTKRSSGPSSDKGSIDQKKQSETTESKENRNLKQASGGQEVEDIFEGVDTGEGMQERKREENSPPSSAAGSNFLNKGLVTFLFFVTLMAVIILGGAYWISEWMVSSI